MRVKLWLHSPKASGENPFLCKIDMIVDTKFYISFSASTEATEMYHLSNFLFLRDQSIGAVLEYPKEKLYAIFFENVKYDIQ